MKPLRHERSPLTTIFRCLRRDLSYRAALVPECDFSLVQYCGFHELQLAARARYLRSSSQLLCHHKWQCRSPQAGKNRGSPLTTIPRHDTKDPEYRAAPIFTRFFLTPAFQYKKCLNHKLMSIGWRFSTNIKISYPSLGTRWG
jgi:hypothetical protein